VTTPVLVYVGALKPKWRGLLHWSCISQGVTLDGPNAQVQGRSLGVAEARIGGGVPCNAQLGR
jgi:hypothetical protein